MMVGMDETTSDALAGAERGAAAIRRAMTGPSLIEFLLARIAEDEREANMMMAQYRAGGDVSKRRWVRVLAECEAKRRIIELCQYELNRESIQQDLAYDVLLDLARVYTDSPGFREEWRP